jgi:cell division cycle 14
VDDYEFYEKVENGDWNWLTPNFIAFASPVEPEWIKAQKSMQEGSTLPSGGGSRPPNSRDSLSSSTNSNLALHRKLPTPFVNCLDYFEKHNVRLVVRLNTMLYDNEHFLERNVNHMELYFDDGTNPTDEIVRQFIEVSDPIVEAGGVVAVHVCSLSFSFRLHFSHLRPQVQSWSWSNWHFDWSISCLEIWVHSE